MGQGKPGSLLSISAMVSGSSIVLDRQSKPYVLYTVTVRIAPNVNSTQSGAGERVYDIGKRWEDFEELYQGLKKNFITNANTHSVSQIAHSANSSSSSSSTSSSAVCANVPSLPPASDHFFGPTFLQERRRLLADWLSLLMSQAALANSECMRSFLSDKWREERLGLEDESKDADAAEDEGERKVDTTGTEDTENEEPDADGEMSAEQQLLSRPLHNGGANTAATTSVMKSGASMALEEEILMQKSSFSSQQHTATAPPPTPLTAPASSSSSSSVASPPLQSLARGKSSSANSSMITTLHPHSPPMGRASKRIGLADFTLLKVIGKGSFGKVMLVRKVDSSRVYAMKVLSKDHIVRRNQVEHTKTERSVLGKLRHPFIVSLRYAFQSRNKLYFVLDYCPGGELFFHLGRAGRFSENRAKFYAAQIVLALKYLHEKQVVYRDLKPENVLLDGQGYIRLTDFGLSKEGVSDNVSAHSFCGTPEYLAPEILTRSGHGRAADWWSLGALLYEMLSGMPPFYSKNRDRLFQKILRAELRLPRFLSADAKGLLLALLDRNPTTRLGSTADADEVLRHPFFAGVDFKALLEKKVEPPFKPTIGRPTDTTNFDVEFTSMPLDSLEHSLAKSLLLTDEPIDDPKFKEFTYQADASFSNSMSFSYTQHINAAAAANTAATSATTASTAVGVALAAAAASSPRVVEPIGMQISSQHQLNLTARPLHSPMQLQQAVQTAQMMTLSSSIETPSRPDDKSGKLLALAAATLTVDDDTKLANMMFKSSLSQSKDVLKSDRMSDG